MTDRQRLSILKARHLTVIGHFVMLFVKIYEFKENFFETYHKLAKTLYLLTFHMHVICKILSQCGIYHGIHWAVVFLVEF